MLDPASLGVDMRPLLRLKFVVAVVMCVCVCVCVVVVADMGSAWGH